MYRKGVIRFLTEKYETKRAQVESMQQVKPYPIKNVINQGELDVFKMYLKSRNNKREGRPYSVHECAKIIEAQIISEMTGTKLKINDREETGKYLTKNEEDEDNHTPNAICLTPKVYGNTDNVQIVTFDLIKYYIDESFDKKGSRYRGGDNLAARMIIVNSIKNKS